MASSSSTKAAGVEGGHYAISDLAKPGSVPIAEGYATAATLHELTGGPAIVAFNGGNLTPIAHISAAYSVVVGGVADG
jgi:putative DNA primase/helicase